MDKRQIAFVAREEIPPSPPPANSVGITGWMHKNLFMGPVNTIVTLVCIAAIAWILPHILSWAVFDSVVNANSLKECRAAGDGACWAVIVERFDQFIYGFYPAEERWRPNVAFLLLLVAIYYALFDTAPARTVGLAYAAVYPLIAYFLIWGGPVLSVLTFALGAVIFWGVAKIVGRFLATPLALTAGAALALVWMTTVPGQFASAPGVDFVGPGLTEIESARLGGFLLALIIGVAGIVLSLPIGVLLALGRRANLPFIQGLSIVFIEFIRGVPLITLLFVANNVLSYFFPPDATVDKILRVVIMVTMFASAYMAEVIRGGLAALPSGQYEAADSLGLDYWKSMRLIILPQALKISIPNIVSTFIGLFKDTTLVVVIGLLDPIGLINNIRGDANWNGIVWEFYVFVGAFFFICCFGMSRYSQHLERKLATDRH